MSEEKITAIPKPTRNRDEAYLAWIRQQPCLLARQQAEGRATCNGPIDPHHVIPDGGGKVGSKVDDRRAVPVCRYHHEQAQRGRETFEAQYDIDLEAEIRFLNKFYKPPVRQTRARRSPRAEVDIKFCSCGKDHHLAFSKAVIDGQFLVYRCPVSNQYTNATIGRRKSQ